MNSFGISAALIIAIVCQASSTPIAQLSDNEVGAAVENALAGIGVAAGKTVGVAGAGLIGTALNTGTGVAETANAVAEGVQKVVGAGMNNGARNAEDSMNRFNDVATQIRDEVAKNVNNGMIQLGAIAESIGAHLTKAMNPSVTSFSQGALAGNQLGQDFATALGSFVVKLNEIYQRNSDVINFNNNFNRMASDTRINSNVAMENMAETAADVQKQIAQVGTQVGDKVEAKVGGVASDGTALVKNLVAA